ncbi:BCCT family transporter [Nocardioides bruguierae]|uniref:BCCT family transporter n=1 Tax=Nocardioides bruguierae TaxID=2945102 RepID=A0A9X2D7A7_9ACTN|nr:BCCT family transporter [Nocardioides bruguierae]MCM0620696.1 BCCT family transporter [Nocardioides bruguierae]
MTSSPPTDRVAEMGDQPERDGSGDLRPPQEPEHRGLLAAPRVFLPSAGIILALVVVALVVPGPFGDFITKVNNTVVQDIGWYYIALVSSFVFFSLWLMAAPVGQVVLGRTDDEEPEFGLMSWFAMLFAAGMGIGLVYWGVAEPLNYLASPVPGTDSSTIGATARTAMDITFLHWGLHAWAIYVVVGLAIAYAVHRKGRPISIRYALEPLFGKRILGFWGDVVDVIAIVGTLFGVATSLGLGVSQVGSGLAFLGVLDEATTPILVVLIAVITAFALASVLSGVDKGIKLLSNINLVVAALLLAAVLVLGPTVFLLSDFVTQIGSYLQNFFQMAFNVRPFTGDAGASFLSSWTTYYWGWWISWAPFVGVFIARISRGRTVREFVAGVLLVPTLVTFLWFSVLGGSALYREVYGQGGLISADGTVNSNTALFEMLDKLPAGTVLSVVAIVLIVVFFVTSSDSGSFVVDMLSEGGNTNPPRWSRAFWATMEGLVAAVLLLAGGLGALQTMSILVAVPFSIVMILMMIALAKALLGEHKAIERRKRRWLAREVANEIHEDDSINLSATTTEKR